MCCASLFKALRQAEGYSEVALIWLVTDRSPSFHIHLMLKKILLQTRMQPNLQTRSPFWIMLSSLASFSVWRETWGSILGAFNLLELAGQTSPVVRRIQYYSLYIHYLVIQTFHFQNDQSGRPVLTLSLQDKG